MSFALAVDGVRAALEEAGASGQEAEDILERDINEWLDGRPCSRQLAKVIQRCLHEGAAPQIVELFANESYPKQIGRLQTRFGLSMDSARLLLARAPLICKLISEEQMSASQVARLLHALEPRLDVPWAAVQAIAGKIGVLPAMTPEQLEAIWAKDADRCSQLFPDGTYLDACEAAAAECRATGMPNNIEEQLRTLLTNGRAEISTPIVPYLQILHFALCPLELYDHCPTMLYEFAPRGAPGEALFDRYGTPTGNPVRNNAKSVAVLDVSWARSKDSQSAMALVAILNMVEQLPFGPRANASAVIRAWLHRVRELSNAPQALIPAAATPESIRSALEAVAVAGTSTAGVIEQRIVDAAAVVLHTGQEWRPRGLGDPVNASNLSRKKLGDVEMQSADKRLSVAYESHGGVLTVPYVDGHLRSLQRALTERYRSEWVHIANSSEWTVNVVFVAHTIAPGFHRRTEEIGGIRVTVDAITYRALAQSLPPPDTPEIQQAFTSHVHGQLNRPTTPQQVRDQYAQLSGLTLLHP